MTDGASYWLSKPIKPHSTRLLAIGEHREPPADTLAGYLLN